MILIILFAFSKLIKWESQLTKFEEGGIDQVLGVGSTLFTGRLWIVEEGHWKRFLSEHPNKYSNLLPEVEEVLKSDVHIFSLCLISSPLPL